MVAKKLIRIEICMLLFDTVAKASVLQIKGHAGYYSCSKCTVEGQHINGRMCFPETNCTKRTNEDFRNQTDEKPSYRRNYTDSNTWFRFNINSSP